MRWRTRDDTSFSQYGYVCLTVAQLRTRRRGYCSSKCRNPNDEARGNDERSNGAPCGATFLVIWVWCFFHHSSFVLRHCIAHL